MKKLCVTQLFIVDRYTLFFLFRVAQCICITAPKSGVAPSGKIWYTGPVFGLKYNYRDNFSYNYRDTKCNYCPNPNYWGPDDVKGKKLPLLEDFTESMCY